MTVRITTWNVNGIRNPFGYQPWRDKRTFDAMFDILEADIVIMQELKIQRKDLRDDMVLVPGWDCYFSLPKHKKGYSGVGIYTRQSACAPIRAEEGVLGVLCPPNSTTPYCELPEDQHIGGYLSLSQLADVGIDAAALDAEGRCVVVEFPAFVLFGVYSPANSSGTRDDFRYGFLNALDIRIRNLIRQGKRVILTGDLNVSRSELDMANAEENMKKEGISHEQYMSRPNCRVFNQLLEGGEVFGERDEGREAPVLYDICRGFHPNRKGMFTHWEQKINARPGNFGSRIDFILCSLSMKSWFGDSNIQEGLIGSDHCPVFAVMKDTVELDGATTNIRDVMSPAGHVREGTRVSEYTNKDIPAFSARLMPEFHQRRSIKDMFGRKPSLKPAAAIVDNSTERDAPKVAAETFASTTEPRSPDDAATMPLSRRSSVTTNASATAPSPMRSPQRKRAAPSSSTSSNPRSLKKSKSNSSTPAPAISDKGQKSLRGFFQPKVPSTKPSGSGKPNDDPLLQASNETTGATFPPTIVEAEEEASEPAVPNEGRQSEQPTALEASNPPSHLDGTSEPIPSQDAVSVEDEAFVDPIVSKESWSKLFSKPVAPRCEHDEPCKVMRTKKTGFNCGREFHMCARPLGPSGAKEKNTQWRCSTFIWSSNWNSSGEREP